MGVWHREAHCSTWPSWLTGSTAADGLALVRFHCLTKALQTQPLKEIQFQPLFKYLQSGCPPPTKVLLLLEEKKNCETIHWYLSYNFEIHDPLQAGTLVCAKKINSSIHPPTYHTKEGLHYSFVLLLTCFQYCYLQDVLCAHEHRKCWEAGIERHMALLQKGPTI